MKNTIYRLIEPKKIIACEAEIDDNQTESVIVRPRYMSICHADQRYYQGQRDPAVLAKKLPMALIHESIGQVVSDPTGHFEKDQWVVMVPNTPFEKDEIIGENYLRTSRFRASGYDGFMQTYVEMRPDLVVPLPDDIDREVLAFLEICTVDYHIIDRFDKFSHGRKDVIGVWGEGNMGYITALMLKYKYPDSKIYVFGLVPEKLNEITFADGLFQVDQIPEDIYVDHAFECVGGRASGIALDQIIDRIIQPEGTIALTGVSEENVPIRTRMVLEKGLRLFGSSRSGVGDFTGTLDFYKAHPEVPKALKRVIGKVMTIDSIDDIHEAFEEDLSNTSAKTVMEWNL